MIDFDQSIDLTDDELRLRRLSIDDYSGLCAAASDNRIWPYARRALEQPALFREHWFDDALAQMAAGKRYVLAILYNNEIIGSSSYYNIAAKHKRVAIGYTFLHPRYWGMGINSRIKKLMVDFAFDTLGVNRIAFFVDHENLRSQQALLKFGAIKEGVLRQHIIRADGSQRDSVVFSIVRNSLIHK